MAIMRNRHTSIARFIRSLYHEEKAISLHAPKFDDSDKKYVIDCIESTFVSSIGNYVDEFEKRTSEFTGAVSAVAVVNGTAALHATLRISGVGCGDEVITQAVTFVATCNAISYLGAHPVFVDVDLSTFGLSPEKLDHFLAKNGELNTLGHCINKKTGRRIAACVPMHTFGHPARIDEIVNVCSSWNIPVIEDCAESLGSWYRGRHTGLFGSAGILSYNGNKIITTGGGGAIISSDSALGARAKHLTTTARIPYGWEFVHDEIGYNYRMPNINAALGCAQMVKLNNFLDWKRRTAEEYRRFFASIGVEFKWEPKDAVSNFWLNAILTKDRAERDSFLSYMNEKGINCRPLWRLMSRLDIYKSCFSGSLATSEYLEDRIVNIPSSVRYDSTDKTANGV